VPGYSGQLQVARVSGGSIMQRYYTASF